MVNLTRFALALSLVSAALCTSVPAAEAAQLAISWIDNASDEGGKVILKDINSPKEYADTLLRQMRRLED